MNLHILQNMSSQTKITLSGKYYNAEVIHTLLKVDTSHQEYDHKNVMWPDKQLNLKEIVEKNKKYVNNITYALKTYGVGRILMASTSRLGYGSWRGFNRNVSF